MDNLIIESDFKSPKVNFNHEKGLLEISGNSIPESTDSFYAPIMEWADQYVKNPATQTTLIYKLDYFNSSSKRCLLNLIEKLILIPDSNKNLIIDWYYEEDDYEMEDVGKLFNEITNFPINLISTAVEE